jgi:hypothetical protein
MPRGISFTNRRTGGSLGLDPGVQLRYELIGQWEKANFMLATFPRKVTIAVNLACRDFTRKYVRQIKQNIQNQGASLGWQPITSQEYRDFKSSYAEADVDSLLRFFNVLSTNVKAYKKEGHWIAGIEDDVVNSKMQILRGEGASSNLTVAEYASVNEFGALHRNIMPRPLWIPSFHQIGGKPELTRLVALHIRKQFPSVKLKLGRNTT